MGGGISALSGHGWANSGGPTRAKGGARPFDSRRDSFLRRYCSGFSFNRCGMDVSVFGPIFGICVIPVRVRRSGLFCQTRRRRPLARAAQGFDVFGLTISVANSEDLAGGARACIYSSRYGPVRRPTDFSPAGAVIEANRADGPTAVSARFGIGSRDCSKAPRAISTPSIRARGPSGSPCISGDGGDSSGCTRQKACNPDRRISYVSGRTSGRRGYHDPSGQKVGGASATSIFRRGTNDSAKGQNVATCPFPMDIGIAATAFSRYGVRAEPSV